MNKTFTYGSYYGVPHEEVLNTDPHYIVYCYEHIMDNGGISRDIYRQAIMMIHREDMSEEYDEDMALIEQELREEYCGDDLDGC